MLAYTQLVATISLVARGNILRLAKRKSRGSLVGHAAEEGNSCDQPSKPTVQQTAGKWHIEPLLTSSSLDESNKLVVMQCFKIPLNKGDRLTPEDLFHLVWQSKYSQLLSCGAWLSGNHVERARESTQSKWVPGWVPNAYNIGYCFSSPQRNTGEEKM